ncbi:MAG: hypothetical protein ACLQPD_15040, partial [Desulfomonilaceae bacterium]
GDPHVRFGGGAPGNRSFLPLVRHRATILADAIVLRHFLNRRATIISSLWDERTRTFKLAPMRRSLGTRKKEFCLGGESPPRFCTTY